MASSTSPSDGSASSNSSTDWTDQVTDLVVDVVDQVRDKTTGPILGGARRLVFAPVALLAGAVVAIVGLILGGRALEMLPFGIWIPYLVLGVAFCAAGFVVWNKRYGA